MKAGHILALVGALMILVGGTVLPWQHFELAEITAQGYQVPITGQGVLGLALGVVLTSALGLLTRKRKEFGTITLFFAVFLFGWLIAAHLTRASNFQLMNYEVVTMLWGYTLAVWGAFFAFFGALVVLAAEPAWDPRAQFLRVAFLWGDTVIQERVLQEPQTFRVGEDLRNDFILPADRLPSKFPLFHSGKKGHYAMGFTPDLAGDVTINQQTKPASEFVEQATWSKNGVDFVDINPGDWGMVNMGELSVFFQFVQPDSKFARRGILAFDELVTASLLVSLFLQVGFLLWAIFDWKETATRVVEKDKKKIPQVDAQVMKEEEEDEPEKDDKKDESTAKKAEGREGKFGDPEKDKKNKIPKNEGKMVDEVDPKKVGLNDLLSSNKLGGKGAISEIMNKNTEGFSNKIAVAMAGSGSQLQVGQGAGGLGFKGSGSGGGGSGGYGRIHGMGEIDSGGGMGVEAGMGEKKEKKVGDVQMGSSSTKGFCDKGNLRAVVKRRAGAIRACYESRLQRNPNLSGKLTIRWTINTRGKVESPSVKKDSVGDSKVANCVMRVLRRMRFKKPEGGMCVVQWPFVFNSG